eukprot:gene19626-22319_t
MANFIRIFDLVAVAPAGADVLQNAANIGDYGTTDDDQIINGAQADVQNPLPQVPLAVQYDYNFIPWNHNPINRIDYPNPVVVPADVTITNRNKLLSILKLFAQAPNRRRDFSFQVYRNGNRVYFFDGVFAQPPGPQQNGNGQNLADQPGRYGIPFETLIATNADATLEKYFVFQSYTLLGVIPLLVRCEVDCVNQTQPPEITEIKSRQTGLNDDDVFLKGAWAQMLFGCTQNLVLGWHTPDAHVDPNDHRHVPAGQIQQPPTTLNNIEELTFAQVQTLADMDNGNDVAALGLLVAVIQWIRGRIINGQTKTFSFRRQNQRFTMP